MWFLIIILVVAGVVARFMGQAWLTQKINKDAEELEYRLKDKVDNMKKNKEDNSELDYIYSDILENYNPNKFVKEITVKYMQHDSKKFNECYLRLNVIVRNIGNLLDLPESNYVKTVIQSNNVLLLKSLDNQIDQFTETIRLEAKELKKLL
jgi:flagellar basal body-associated protein FliL